MLRPGTSYIRFHIAAILAIHWDQFVAKCTKWIRPVVFENVLKVLACRTPVLGCHVDPRFSIKYIGRYTKRAVMAEYRIVHYDGKLVRFSYKDYAQDRKTSYKTMKGDTFIGRLITHIPDKHFPMVRHAGLFANGWKHRYLTLARDALNQLPTDDYPQLQLPWAERQEEYTGTSPLVCTNCACPMEFVGIVFGKWDDVQIFFRRAGRDDTIPKPLLSPG